MDDALGQYGPDVPVATDAEARFDAIYAGMGLVASGPPLSYVANVGTFATASPDTSFVVVALSLPNRGLTFGHDSLGYHAAYEVRILLRRDGSPDIETRDRDTVRVAGLRETTRSDESVIYRRVLRIPPGAYRATFAVLDVGSRRSLERTATLVVRRFASGTATRPVVVYESTPRTRLESPPEYLARPRASAVFGVDDSVLVYEESYATGPTTFSLTDSAGRVRWTSTVQLPHRTGAGGSTLPLASGVISIPLAGAELGVLSISASRPGGTDTAFAGLYLGFGPDLPVMSFEQMLGYLSLFTTPGRIRSLRTASPGARGAVWTAFLHETDPRPQTPQNEALDAYFSRIRLANAAFRSDAPRGWRSDRGSVYVALGEPTRVSEGYATPYELGEPGMLSGSRLSNRVHVLVWDYDPLQARIVFYNPGDTGVWRFAPGSAQTFRALLGRALLR